MVASPFRFKRAGDVPNDRIAIAAARRPQTPNAIEGGSGNRKTASVAAGSSPGASFDDA